MKTKFNGILTLLLAFTVHFAFAQKTVSGTVSDNSGPLPGVSVLIKGSNIGAETDFDGKYALQANEGDVLQFSYVGMKTVDKTVGAANTIDVIMTVSEENVLDEVVVTALGISREKKSLGYAVQQVKGDEITKAKDANFVNSLSGKVAGVNIKRSTQMGGSSDVVIRGSKSLYGNNQALFVVDGTPISNEIDNSLNQQTGRGGYDYGNAAMDINPEDVESVSVLRGAAATALYGSRAANGVILVTTKKGKKNKTLGVTVSSGISLTQVDNTTLPRYQKQYGPGYSTLRGWYASDYVEEDPNGFDYFDFGDGEFLAAAAYEDASYGPEFDPSLMVYTWESYFPELDTYGQLQPFVASDNDANTFYKGGHVVNNSVSVDGGTDNSSYRLSYTNFNQNGNLPNSSIQKNVVSFSGGYDITEKFKANSSVSFINTDALGRYGTGYDNRNPNQSFRQWYAVSTDFKRQKEVYDLTGLNISWNPYGALDASNPTKPHYFDNYYFNRFENYQNDERNRLMGNFSLSYDLAPWATLTGKVSMDRYDEIQEERIAVGSVDVSMYSRDNNEFREINYDLISSFKKSFDNVSFAGDLGLNLRRSKYSSIFASTNGGLVVPGIYALANSASPIIAPPETAWEIATNGYFGRASLGYNNFLYLDLTGRYDISSTLPKDDNAYFYPSASLSLVFSKLLNVEALSFGKLRLNYAEVGSDTDAHRIFNTFDFVSPFGSTPMASASNTFNNSELRPEYTKSYEAGLELMFAKDRLGLDLSVYKTNTYDQIIPIAVTGATGNLFKVVNAGNVQNQGLELAFKAIPIKTDNFSWNLNATWAKNENEVIELLEDQDNIQLASVQGGVTINATVGEPFGAIWGTNYVYHTNGEPIVYPHWRSGMRYRKTSAPEVIGNINPDWKAGISNNLSYKNLSLGFLIDIQQGGNFFSLDTWYGYATGLYDFTAGLNDKGNPVRTLPEDGGGLPIGGVIQTGTDDEGNPISDGTVNEEYGDASDVYSSFGYVYAPNAYHVYDASFVKLRELTLSYSLPSKMLNNTFISGIDFSLLGRNLWIIHKNSEYSDPEAGLSAGSYRGNQSGAYPSVKEYGLNLKFKF